MRKWDSRSVLVCRILFNLWKLWSLQGDLTPYSLNIWLALPIGTATVESSFSEMKMIETRLKNQLSDSSLNNLMKIAVEGPQLENKF